MSVGPCLCGDPYCQSCFPGNDGGAREEWVEHVDEITSEFTMEECAMFERVGLAAVEAFRQAQEEIRKLQMEAYAP